MHSEKLKGIDSWINFHSQRAPALEWPIERMADLKITSKQCSNKGETTLTPGREEDDIRSRQLARDPRPGSSPPHLEALLHPFKAGDEVLLKYEKEQ